MIRSKVSLVFTDEMNVYKGGEVTMRSFSIVALDESKGWTQPELVKACGGVIYTLYVFDPQEQTRCCEFTPSYWLEPISVEPISLPEDEDEREKLRDALDEGFHQTNEGIYVHCHTIDGLDDKYKLTLDDFDSDTTLDDAREHFSSNGYAPPVLCGDDPVWEDCGSCGMEHPVGFTGDCRDNENRR